MISKKLFTTIVMVGAFLMSATTQAQKVNTSTEISQLQVNDDDSGTRVIKYSADGHRYRIVMNGDKIGDVYVDGAKLTASRYADYEPAVKKIIARIEADLHQAALNREKAYRQRGEAMKHRESAEAQHLKAQQLAKEAAGHQEHLNETIKESKEQAIRAKRLAEKQHEAAEDLNKQKQAHRSQAEVERKQAKVQAAQSEAARQQAKIHRMQADKDRARAEKDRQLLDDLIDEVVSDGLSQSKGSLTSLVLDAESLSVNGVKQSAELHAKYKSKYLKSPAKKITYKRSETSTSIMID